MVRPHRFYIPPEEWSSPWVLRGTEAAHAAKSLRCRPGDEVAGFDGQGRTGIFRVLGFKSGEVKLELLAEEEFVRSASGLVLALGWTKGLRRGWLLEKAAELGAEALWFWSASRSQGRIPGDGKGAWLGQVLAGAKQSGNPFLPKIEVLPGGAEALAARAGSFDQAIVLWEGLGEAGSVLDQNSFRTGRCLAVVGPEGGLTSLEVETLIRGGCRPAGLGSRILRWETAALVCLVLAHLAQISAGAGTESPQ
ncbi:MAG: 16S rRNA (uracil(1498)-N(3))-methyltransferase [Deltaproteobacteria bacterium]|nr:16S rRNA (uracil(1498)-N(3))-methyltransferase [Deltaproteobacteria bacterium]